MSARKGPEAPELPAWAEDVIRRWGPQPPRGASTANPDALLAYNGVINRFRRRWHAELDADVWVLFREGRNFHERQAVELLGAMLDAARLDNRREVNRTREAVPAAQDLARESRASLVRFARQLRQNRTYLEQPPHIDVDIGGDLREIFGRLAAKPEFSDWADIIQPVLSSTVQGPGMLDILEEWVAMREPVVEVIDTHHRRALHSRKRQSDALHSLLSRLSKLNLAPVELTHHARATIYNVTFDLGPEQGQSTESMRAAFNRSSQTRA